MHPDLPSRPPSSFALLLSVVATLSAGFAGLAFLASAAMSGAFLAQVPQGSDAMGLVVPLFVTILGALALAVSALLVTVQGKGRGFGWPAWAFNGVAWAGGAGAFGVLLAWMERMGSWVGPVGWLLGILLPLALCTLVIRMAWARPDGLGAAEARAWRWMSATLVVLVLLLGAQALRTFVASERVARAEAEAAVAEVAAETSRRAALSPLERLREDYAQMSPDTPLWVFVAGLPEAADDAVRDFMIERALAVPGFDTQLAQTLADEHPRYRHGALVLVQSVPAEKLKPEWRAGVLAAFEATEGQVSGHPEWMIADGFANPDPAAHLRTLRQALLRFPEDESGADALEAIRTAVSAWPEGEARTAALEALQ